MLSLGIIYGIYYIVKGYQQCRKDQINEYNCISNRATWRCWIEHFSSPIRVESMFLDSSSLRHDLNGKILILCHDQKTVAYIADVLIEKRTLSCGDETDKSHVNIILGEKSCVYNKLDDTTEYLVVNTNLDVTVNCALNSVRFDHIKVVVPKRAETETMMRISKNVGSWIKRKCLHNSKITITYELNII